LTRRAASGCRTGAASGTTAAKSTATEPASTEEPSNAASEAAAAELHRALIPAGAAVIGKKVGQEVRRFCRIGVLQMKHLTTVTSSAPISMAWMTSATFRMFA